MRHVKAFSAAADVVAIPAREERRGELEAQGLRTAGSLKESGAAAAVIATDTGRHGADARTALELGMDVLIEKPLALDAAQARRVADAARKGRRRAFVACILRFSESLGRARELLPRLGRLSSVRIECRSYLPDWRPQRDYRQSYSARADEGGVLRDLIHELDYALWLFGPAVSPEGRCSNSGTLGIESEDAAELNWRTRDRAEVSVGLDYLGKPPLRRLVVQGESGTLTWDGVAQTTTLGADRFESRQTVEDRFAAQAAAFLAALDGKNDERLCDLEAGVAALELCDLARRNQVTA